MLVTCNKAEMLKTCVARSLFRLLIDGRSLLGNISLFNVTYCARNGSFPWFLICLNPVFTDPIPGQFRLWMLPSLTSPAFRCDQRHILFLFIFHNSYFQELLKNAIFLQQQLKYEQSRARAKGKESSSIYQVSWWISRSS